MNALLFRLSKDGAWLVTQNGECNPKTGVVTIDDPTFVDATSPLGLAILAFQAKAED